MNGVKPIPAELLTDGAVLLTPTGSGYLRDNLDSVRIVRVSAITDYTTGRTRDCTELVMYFDCVNSSPSGTEFAAGQSLEYCGETYEVVSAELFAGEDPHHWRGKEGRYGRVHNKEELSARQLARGKLPHGEAAQGWKPRACAAAQSQEGAQIKLGGQMTE